MKKFLASLVYTFVFMTFAVGAQAAPISSWGYNLNMDFVNSDGSLSDIFTWQTVTPTFLGDRIATGTITGAENSLSGTVSKTTWGQLEFFDGEIISAPLSFEKVGTTLESASGTVRFAFDFFPEGNLDLAQKLSFDVSFSVDPSGLIPSLVFEASSMDFYYDGYNYEWNLAQATGILNAGLAYAPNLSLTFNATEANAPTATPEPATMLLMGAGLAGLGAMRRRRAGK